MLSWIFEELGRFISDHHTDTETWLTKAEAADYGSGMQEKRRMALQHLGFCLAPPPFPGLFELITDVLRKTDQSPTLIREAEHYASLQRPSKLEVDQYLDIYHPLTVKDPHLWFKFVPLKEEAMEDTK
ncbi:hypothetical protein JX266_013643 [Neoarthrinium moseri]|nr:hypothetical protein JX266_013643 [Neoarthrinium moseri]